MEKYITTIILFALSSSCNKQYRTDYVYNRKSDAFYKLHTETALNSYAQSACQTEGGELMVPSTQWDIIQVHGMLKEFPDIGDVVWIGDDGLQHEPAEEETVIEIYNPTTEGYPWKVCEVISRSGKIESAPCYRRLPFICKVDAKDAPFDSQCRVFSRDYKYFENVGSCYKIPGVVYSWNQAYDECAAEGAHLMVLNSELEHQVVRNLTHAAPMLSTARTSWFFFAGIRAEKTFDGSPRIFKTIFGQTLEEAGYNQWSQGEPNNAQGKEYCGSIFKNDGKYNDLDCTHTYEFVCEKEVKNKH